MDKIEAFVIDRLGGEGSGHDHYHCFRVRDVALKLSQLEGKCNLQIIEVASLLHDIPDPKICKNIDEAIQNMKELMKSISMTEDNISEVLQIINKISFKGAKVDTTMPTIEGKIVQDADRLDAIGAIGIARCFAFGGSRGRPIYNPEESTKLHEDEQSYRASTSSGIGHFHEKLLLLKDMMQTESGKRVAEKRHQVLVDFLKEFETEWHGDDVM